MNDKIRYISFPIAILREQDISKICRNAFDYGIYAIAEKYRLESHRSDVYVEHIRKALEDLSLKVSDNEEGRKKRGKVIFDSFDSNTVMVSVNMAILLQYANDAKTAFEIEVFRAFCAIRSMIGTKAYYKGTDNYLMARMYGFATIKEFSDSKQTPLTRYKLDKIKGCLRLHWGLKYYARNVRGFYVSFALEEEELACKAEGNRETYLRKQLAERSKKAYEEAMKWRANKKPPQ